MSDNFLDKAGLSHFWNKIKEYVGQYLPLSGGTVTGDVKFARNITMTGETNKYIIWSDVTNSVGHHPMISANMTSTTVDGESVRYPIIGFHMYDPDNYSGNPIVLSGVARPKEISEAANKGYVDDSVSAAKPIMRTVTLTASGWSNNSQTVTVQGVLADSTKQAITVTPSTKTNMNNASSAGVWCASQGSNSLTFTCDSVPTSDITFNIKIQEAIS